MNRMFWLAVSGSVLLAAGAALTPAAAAPLAVSSAAFAGIDFAAARAEPVAARHRPVRRTAKLRKSGSQGVRVAPADVDGDGVPDTVVSKPKPTRGKPAGSTGGVYVQ